MVSPLEALPPQQTDLLATSLRKGSHFGPSEDEVRHRILIDVKGPAPTAVVADQPPKVGPRIGGKKKLKKGLPVHWCYS